jgi:hypothetical protein
MATNAKVHSLRTRLGKTAAPTEVDPSRGFVIVHHIDHSAPVSEDRRVFNRLVSHKARVLAARPDWDVVVSADPAERRYELRAEPESRQDASALAASIVIGGVLGGFLGAYVASRQG